MKSEKIYSLILTIGVISIVVGVGFFILKEMNSQVKGYEESCSRYSINEYEDNCMCPCDEPNWIERKLGLGTLCDGWIVGKNESCLSGVKNIN